MFTRRYADLQELVDNVFNNIEKVGENIKSKYDYNIYEQEEFTFIECLLPGYEKSQIRIDLFQDRIEVSTSNSKKSELSKRYITKMFELGNKTFSFKLSPELLAGEITSSLENGILTIKIKPKNSSFKTNIEIN